jgi:O-antigen/teichoic acid export membrane protein
VNVEGDIGIMDSLKGKVFKNASWIIAGKLMQSIIAFFISILTARYLGPSNYGLISYASSLVAFVLPIAQLGFKNTLVQEFTSAPEREGKILGTSIFFSVILGIQTLVKYLMGTAVEGFTTVILLILIVGGFIMLSLGIIGHYIARIYEEIKGRPKYIISRVTDRVEGNVVGAWQKGNRE